jgi:hypothetical protein
VGQAASPSLRDMMVSPLFRRVMGLPPYLAGLPGLLIYGHTRTHLAGGMDFEGSVTLSKKAGYEREKSLRQAAALW